MSIVVAFQNAVAEDSGMKPISLGRILQMNKRGDGANSPERPATNLRSVPGFVQIGPVAFFPRAREIPG